MPELAHQTWIPKLCPMESCDRLGLKNQIKWDHILKEEVVYLKYVQCIIVQEGHRDLVLASPGFPGKCQGVFSYSQNQTLLALLPIGAGRHADTQHSTTTILPGAFLLYYLTCTFPWAANSPLPAWHHQCTSPPHISYTFQENRIRPITNPQALPML